MFVDFRKNQAEAEYNETVTAAKASDRKDGDPEYRRRSQCNAPGSRTGDLGYQANVPMTGFHSVTTMFSIRPSTAKGSCVTSCFTESGSVPSTRRSAP